MGQQTDAERTPTQVFYSGWRLELMRDLIRECGNAVGSTLFWSVAQVKVEYNAIVKGEELTADDIEDLHDEALWEYDERQLPYFGQVGWVPFKRSAVGPAHEDVNYWWFEKEGVR